MRSKKILMNTEEERTIAEIFEDFTTSAKARGLSEVTIRNYYNHLHSISKHLDIQMPLGKLTRRELDAMIVSMRDSGLAYNSIASYTRVLKTFLGWCKERGLSSVTLPNMRDKETVKDTYTDEELETLLKKPPKDCGFCDYRNWVIVNFLLNCGCRAATVRNIQNRDVNLDARQVMFRHNKNGKVQVIPLCNLMCSILRDYMAIRKGEGEDYLFCDQYGEMLTENGLRLAITHYNHSRGVKKTSIHAFRHTFARKYLIDCGGDAFTLQKILGHSTLNMTRHYCKIFDADIAKNYDRFSPLAQMNHPKEKIRKRA